MTGPGQWFPDPTGRSDRRFWDGTSWTDQIIRRGIQSTDSISDGYARPGCSAFTRRTRSTRRRSNELRERRGETPLVVSAAEEDASLKGAAHHLAPEGHDAAVRAKGCKVSGRRSLNQPTWVGNRADLWPPPNGYLRVSESIRHSPWRRRHQGGPAMRNVNRCATHVLARRQVRS